MIFAGIAAVLAGVGVVQALAGALLAGRFAAAAPSPGERDRIGARVARGDPITRTATLSRGAGRGDDQPAITILKPLHGDEPLLEQALASVCAQDYAEFQVVFGVQDAADTALPVVARVRARFPACDIAVVVDPAGHGANGKVGNLINMLPRAKHDVLAIADSDLHVQPDYLVRLAETLGEPGTGLVTTLYSGLPAANRLTQRLGATQITHYFLPGALLARAMGRQDCLGATMLLRRATLGRIGGLQALADHLADDQVLGRRVAALGLAVRLAPTVPATTVPEMRLRDLLRHELRWARTIRALEPAAFAASVLQYPLFWAVLAVPLSDGGAWSFGVFFLAWVGRALAAIWVDRALEPFLVPPAGYSSPRLDVGGWGEGEAAAGPGELRLEDGMNLADASAQGLAFPCPVWLLPLRELISVGVMLASYAGRQVEWRGRHLTADTPGRAASGSTAPD
ncbi:MAG TPA: bacteriohopanetetrol glucosamine biosynthesis glycosyltransferase HpnI [Acetobacteraceae bacterium]|nr:bacteriohopanetetrol glucosamine biosynthesis glycosyltransferase HpnI [Acetobacteraceae bacterium]